MFSVPEEEACRDERERETKPERDKSNHCGEGDSTGRLCPPEEEVQGEGDGEEESGERERESESSALPVQPSKSFVKT